MSITLKVNMALQAFPSEAIPVGTNVPLAVVEQLPEEFEASEYAGQGIHFTYVRPEDVILGNLNVLTQTRKRMSKEGVDELAKSIEGKDDEGEPAFELYAPPMVNHLDPVNARKYVDDLNDCHGTEHRFEDLIPDENGWYKIVIAGHRRRRAMLQIVQEYGADPKLSTTPASVHGNLPFIKSLKRQLHENTGEPLTVVETARAIRSIHDYGVSTGEYKSVADCVRDLPYSYAKVSDALRFSELPVHVQDLVEDGKVVYGAAVALYPLQKELPRLLKDRKSDEYIDELVSEYFDTALQHIRDEEWGIVKTTEYVRNVLASHHQEPEELVLTLFEIDELKEARNLRDKVTRSLLLRSLDNLEVFRRVNGGNYFNRLTPIQKAEMVEALQRTLSIIGNVASKDEIPEQIGFEIA